MRLTAGIENETFEERVPYFTHRYAGEPFCYLAKWLNMLFGSRTHIARGAKLDVGRHPTRNRGEAVSNTGNNVVRFRTVNSYVMFSFDVQSLPA